MSRAVRTQLADEDQMTIEEFLAFTDTRPDGERWELIEGVAVLNPSPTNFHQIIAGNIYMALGTWKLSLDVPWVPLLGVGTRVPVSPRSLPQPDVQVMATPPTGEASPVTDDALVLFEVLSKSNTKADRAWRLKAYRSIANCQHYVTLAQDQPLVTRYDRSTGWKPLAFAGVSASFDLPALGAVLMLGDIYRWTPAGGAAHP